MVCTNELCYYNAILFITSMVTIHVSVYYCMHSMMSLSCCIYFLSGPPFTPALCWRGNLYNTIIQYKLAGNKTISIGLHIDGAQPSCHPIIYSNYTIHKTFEALPRDPFSSRSVKTRWSCWSSRALQGEAHAGSGSSSLMAVADNILLGWYFYKCSFIVWVSGWILAGC